MTEVSKNVVNWAQKRDQTPSARRAREDIDRVVRMMKRTEGLKVIAQTQIEKKG